MPMALMRRWLPIVWCCVLLTGALWSPARAQQAPPFDPDNIPAPANAPSARAGQGIYAENCAPCHGADGASDGPTVSDLPAPPPAFADPETTWAVSPAEYFHITKYGRIQNLMPPWQNQLSDVQIWQAVAFVWSLHTDQTAIEHGAAQYDSSCASCHGETGRGDGPDGGDVQSDFSDQSAMMRVSDADLSQGWNEAHPDLGGEWSGADRRATLDYIRTFTYMPPWESAYEAGEGAVAGRLIQGTPEGTQPSAVSLTLYGFLDFTQVMSATTVSAADGTFQFEELDTDPEIAYIVEANYNEIAYTSDFFRLNPDAPVQALDLSVYEAGDDDSGLVVNRANWIIDHRPGELIVGEILVYSNRSDRAYTGKAIEGANRPVTLALPIPPDAFDLQFQDGVLGGRYLRIDDMIWDTAAVPPGEEIRQIFASYRLAYDDAEIALEKRWPYPVERLNLLVATLPDLTVEADPLTFVATETLEGAEFELWVTEALAAENAIAADLSGLLPAGSVDPRQLAEGDAEGLGTNMPAATAPPLEPWVPLAVGGIGVAAMAALLTLRRNRTADPAALMAVQRDDLVKQIAALDDRHASGHLSDDAWTQERARLKARLLDTARQLSLMQPGSE